MFNKNKRRKKISLRIRKKISGTASVPRLSVFRSNKSIYCQAIDDLQGVTIASASSKGINANSKSEVAKEVGKQVAEKLKSQNVDTVIFDRGGYLYHGRVKALADGVREGGIQF